jgi:ferredoxin/flavodoxin---NADP+ reductase
MHQHTLSGKILTYSEEIAEDVFLLGFRRDFEFQAGQVIGISVEREGPRRLYSICSGEQEEEVRILYNVIDEGYLTPRLSDLAAGDTIWITGPRGDFIYDPAPAVWIATGTGIAPFYSMLRSAKYENKLLIHGERYLEKFYFFDEFSSHLGKNYIRCCTGEEAEGVFGGRVTDYLGEVSLPPGHKYYLCGRAEMVVETRDLLIGRGIPFTNIISEIYF